VEKRRFSGRRKNFKKPEGTKKGKRKRKENWSYGPLRKNVLKKAAAKKTSEKPRGIKVRNRFPLGGVGGEKKKKRPMASRIARADRTQGGNFEVWVATLKIART